MGDEKASSGPDPEEYRVDMGRAAVPPALNDKERRPEWGLPDNDTDQGDYMVELNLFHRRGLQAAADAFLALYQERVTKDLDRQPRRVAKTYFSARMSVVEWRRLVRADEEGGGPKDRCIYRIWPDFPVKSLIDHSVSTVKADAAYRSYGASGTGITWAVIDSGVDADHPHFGAPDAQGKTELARHTLRHEDVASLHRDFTVAYDDEDLKASEAKRNAGLEQRIAAALRDEFGHGTHVAGIISGGLPADADKRVHLAVYERVFESNPDGGDKREKVEERSESVEPEVLRGVAPRCKLVSLKVLNAKGTGRTSDVMRALEYVREHVNGDPKVLRVHGVNLSVGYEFDAEMFACGQSPLCVEVDRLVQSGVVVVTAAGNTGYGLVGAQQRPTKVGLSNTINDPGNAAQAITVGATHRDAPHTYGVSYFSSKGPTGDGRLKPDLVAPGERITSCAAGAKLQYIKDTLARMGQASPGSDQPGKALAAYLDQSGTSQAAPHVSGAIAAFLSIRREFIGKPAEVKRIFLQSATSLGRERYFEGHGLVDLMRAIQSV